MSLLDNDGLYFLPLGGSDCIGMNMYAYAVNGEIIVVDCGYAFLNDDYPGMDLSFADPSFLENYADRVKGLFITHAHEDHFGAIAQVWPKLNCPVYAMRFTAGLIRERLKEYHLDSEVPLFEVNDHPEIVLGDFDVRFVPVTHSVPETCALLIKTPKGTVVHATDWRFDDGNIEFLQTS